ncbi:hypothetical protein D3C85_1527260 [compost metagenome]
MVTRSPFCRNQLPSSGTESIPSCAIPARAVIPTAEARGPVMVIAVAMAAGAAAGPMIGMAAVDAYALRPAVRDMAWAFAPNMPAALD